MSCAAESFCRPLSPRTFWHSRSNVKNPDGSCTQVWWRALVIGPASRLPPAKQSARRIQLNAADIWVRQASLMDHLSSSPERAWEVSVKGQVRGVGATSCSINPNVLGRVGVSWFDQSGPTSALSAWPRTPSPTAHAGLYFPPLFFCRLSDSLLHHRTRRRARYERVQVCQKYMAKIRSKSQSTIHTLMNSAVIGSHSVFAGNKLIHLWFLFFFHPTWALHLNSVGYSTDL